MEIHSRLTDLKKPVYTLILVTYNRGNILKDILNSILSFEWSYLSFIIVDNCSNDSTPEILNSFSKKMPITIITSNENIGHGAGLALAFKFITNSVNIPEFLIFLEDDSIPSKNLADSLLLKIHESEFSLLSSLGSISKLGKRTIVNSLPGQIIEVDFAVFDGAIMRTEVIKQVGFPESDWFMMVDDYEYCYRLKRKGFKIGVIYNDFHQILHLGAGTGFSKSSLWRGYYQERNYVFFVKKHFSWFNFFDFSVFFLKRIVGSFSAPDRFERLKLKFIGLWHGIVNKKGKTLDPTTLKFE